MKRESNKVTAYGIKTILVNDLPVYTVLIRGNYSEENKAILNSHNITFTVNFNCTKIYIRFTDTNYNQFKLFVSKLGKALKEIAQVKLNKKYQWTLFN